MLEKVEGLNMERVIEEFERVTKDAGRIQRETLKRILEDNASAEYLLNFGLNGRTDPESFKAFVPLVTHKELEPYINRILDGDTSSVLTAKPITTMSLRSDFTHVCFISVVEFAIQILKREKIGIFAVLALLRESQNLYHGMRNCLTPHCIYITPLLPSGSGFQFHLLFIVFLNDFHFFC